MNRFALDAGSESTTLSVQLLNPDDLSTNQTIIVSFHFTGGDSTQQAWSISNDRQTEIVYDGSNSGETDTTRSAESLVDGSSEEEDQTKDGKAPSTSSKPATNILFGAGPVLASAVVGFAAYLRVPRV